MSEINQTHSKRGGARKRAGRKAGSATQKTRAIADRAAAEGITPLEVMLEAMNSFRGAGDLEKAASFAKDAAPYMHPRLAAVEHTGEDGGPIDHNLAVQFVGVK
jgi:hypothetical protein